MEVSEGAQEEEREESPMDHSAPPPAPPPQSHVHAADPRHYWGRGNVMEGEGQPDEGILKHKRNQFLHEHGPCDVIFFGTFYVLLFHIDPP